MREIKFRAWDKTKMRFTVEHDELAVTFNGDIIHTGGGVSTRNDLQIMQYTGLKDKNGIKIYEGDIVNEQYHQSPSFIVEYKDGAFNPFDDFKSDIFYVTGNIHENPELLKGDK